MQDILENLAYDPMIRNIMRNGDNTLRQYMHKTYIRSPYFYYRNIRNKPWQYMYSTDFSKRFIRWNDIRDKIARFPKDRNPKGKYPQGKYPY